MKRKDWFLLLTPLFGVWLADYFAKLWGHSLASPFEWAFIRFHAEQSSGAFLKVFSDLPPMIRIFSLCTIGVFFALSLGIANYVWPIKSLRLKFGLSFLLGGLSATLYDWIIWGHEITLFSFKFLGLESSNLNIAGISSWIGLGFIGVALLKDKPLFWPPENNRRRLWINPNYQLRFIMLLLGSALSITLVEGLFSYTYLAITINSLNGENDVLTNKILVPYLLTFFFISLNFCAFLIFLGRKISHRQAGPIYAFDKYISDLIEGRNRRFTLRADDEFKQLEITGRKIAEHLLENNLIDIEDEVKVLTTYKENSEDFSLGAVPMDGQSPDYSNKNTSLPSSLRQGASLEKVRPDCPICQKRSDLHYQSSFGERLVECVYCHSVFDPSAPFHKIFSLKNNQLQLPPDAHFHRLFQQIANANNLDLDSASKPIFSLTRGSRPGDWLTREFAATTVDGTLRLQEATSPLQHVLTSKSLSESLSKESSSSHDLIILNQALEWSSNPHDLLEYCFRQLSSNGILVISTPNKSSSQAYFLNKNWILANEEPFVLFDPEIIAKVLSTHSFDVLSCETTFTSMTLEEILNRLKTYGWHWPQTVKKFIPKAFRQSVHFKMPLGYMTVVAKKRPSQAQAMAMGKASNL